MKLFNKLLQTSLFAESWNVAWRQKQSGSILFDKITPFTIIQNSFRYWAADPFIIEKNGEVYIFAELYDYIKRKGVLGCCKLNKNGKSNWIPIISEKFHLSYPYIFERNEQVFIMPESGAGNVLLLYQAVEFPYKWKKIRVLRKDVNFADTTPLLFEKSRFAITHNVQDPYNPQLALIDLENEYPDKIINTDVPFKTRPAGKPFVFKNEYVRPAQISLDCNSGYGKSIIFYKFNIDGDLYSEKPFCEIKPDDLNYTSKIYLDGMHTYNGSDHFEVIDIKTRRFNLLNFIFRLFGRFVKQ